jgi:hypothetical protein
VWLGAPPTDAIDAQRRVYEGYSPAAAQQHWADEHTIADDDPVSLAERVRASIADAGADACNLRVHMPGIPPDAIRAQITALGAEVVPALSV